MDTQTMTALFYPWTVVIMLIILAYAAIADIRTRMAYTWPFTLMEVLALFVYLMINPWYAIFAIPPIFERFESPYTVLGYLIYVLPVIYAPSILIPIVVIPIIIPKAIQFYSKFGSADVKAIQSIALTTPVWPHVPLAVSLFSPAVAVFFLASVFALVAVARQFGVRGGLLATGVIPANRVSPREAYKYWMRADGTAMYKIPFLAYTFIAYIVVALPVLL